MRTIKLSLVIAFLASFAVINEIIAQGISLSFNLTKNDTLANMIADSKKYDIKSLTLSGYVNEANIKFITDINKNGTLRFLNLKDCSFVETYYISDEISRLFQEFWP